VIGPYGQEEASESPRQQRPSTNQVCPESTRRPIDAGEMEQFLTGSSMMCWPNINTGATVSVVRDGQLFFTKGYGLANVEQNIPVRAEQTLFRIGSTSKCLPGRRDAAG